jgi:hypothetical protein
MSYSNGGYKAGDYAGNDSFHWIGIYVYSASEFTLANGPIACGYPPDDTIKVEFTNGKASIDVSTTYLNWVE